VVCHLLAFILRQIGNETQQIRPHYAESQVVITLGRNADFPVRLTEQYLSFGGAFGGNWNCVWGFHAMSPFFKVFI